MLTDGRLVVLSRVVALVTIACGIASVVISQVSGLGGMTQSNLQQLSGTLIAPVVTWIAIPRVPRNGSVWAFTFVGLSLGLVTLGDTVAEAVSGITERMVNAENASELIGSTAPADLPLIAALGLMLALSMWVLSFALMPTLVLLLFPDGDYPEPVRWWRIVGRGTIALVGTTVIANVIVYWPTSSMSYAAARSDLTPAGIVAGIGSMLIIVVSIACIVGFVIKWRRSAGEARTQFKWVGFAFFTWAVWSIIVIVIGPLNEAYRWDVASWIMIVFIPFSYTVAILKYRLYGIDVVISKTLTYGVLAAFITGLYAMFVVGIGSFIGGGDEPNVALSIAAVAIVAVAFEPVRVRVQHWANVVVYGKRATPYEVLASATARLSDTSDPDEALARVTQLVADGTGAVEAVLWLKVGDVMYPRATSPPDVLAGLDAVAGEDPVAGIVGDRVVAVRHRGDVLGALSITKDRADAVTGSDEKVLEDVAAGAGVLLRNMGLNAELAERAEQLRVSRRRLVAAQDAERRRLERDLHDGAQQQVVALKVKLGIARTLAEREGAESVAGLVASLSDTTQEAVDGMRAVAHGIYPPLLEAEGLEAALASARRTVAIPVDIAAERIVRYERSVEESVYFCVLGVVADAVDAGATRVAITLHGGLDAVRFSVDADSAVGDLVAVEDRVDALNGTVHIDRNADRTVVVAELPARSRSLEPA